MKEASNQPNLYSILSYIPDRGEFENLISVSGSERVWKSFVHNVVDENQNVAV